MMSETDLYIQKLIVSNPLMEPVYKDIIRAMELLPGSRGLDVGCGIGLQAILLAEAVDSDGHVIGLDITPKFLAHAKKIVEKAGFRDRVSFKIGDMNELPFDNNTFDWLWSANCVGYPAREPLPLLKELARVVKPGGEIAILIYASQMLLPGYPLLEARLNATSIGIAPFTADMRPETHYMRFLGWFQKAGFENGTVQSFVSDVQAPLGEEKRAALAALIDMRWGGAESEVSFEDWAQFLRLTQPDSPEYILDLPDYYAFITCALFRGRVV
jgi:ubiquinone/menaquinone biosynthesis C-methylase UbiE